MTIVLADSSYTIRRIVELSFSEMENVGIFSLENGQGIKEKLLELKPRIVIADVKLPVINGYEICQFINQTPQLSNTKVFLMKGSFEPINQELIKSLKYEEIITKPFDSNLLVAAVSKILEQGEASAQGDVSEFTPEATPEEEAEIETESHIGDELNFADIREEILSHPKVHPSSSPPPPAVVDDEIQPSEEITQQQMPKDDLAPELEMEDGFSNPFAGDGSAEPPISTSPMTADQQKDSPVSSDMDQFPDFPGEIEMEKISSSKAEPVVKQKEAAVSAAGFPEEVPELVHEFDLPEEPATAASEEPSLLAVESNSVSPNSPPDTPIEMLEMDIPGMGDEKLEAMAMDDTSEAVSESLLEEKEEISERFPEDFGEPQPMKIELMEGESLVPEEESLAKSASEGLSGISHVFGEKQIPTEDKEMDTEGQFFPVEEEVTDSFVLVNEPSPVGFERAKPVKGDDSAGISGHGEKVLDTAINEQLNGTIREVLWEIIPKMAERIIREEIDKIKSDINKNS